MLKYTGVCVQENRGAHSEQKQAKSNVLGVPRSPLAQRLKASTANTSFVGFITSYTRTNKKRNIPKLPAKSQISNGAGRLRRRFPVTCVPLVPAGPPARWKETDVPDGEPKPGETAAGIKPLYFPQSSARAQHRTVDQKFSCDVLIHTLFLHPLPFDGEPDSYRLSISLFFHSFT